MASRKRLNSGADDGPPNKTSHQPSVLIAQSAQPPQQTRAPPKQLNSDIEMNLVKQRLKKMETEWADRGKQLSHKQAEINCLKKQMDAMRADYEDKITKLTTLLRFEVSRFDDSCCYLVVSERGRQCKLPQKSINGDIQCKRRCFQSTGLGEYRFNVENCS